MNQSPLSNMPVDSDPATDPAKFRRGPAGAIAMWLLVQLLALSAAAGRVPLSAHYPRPIEQTATALMLVTQVVAAALLSPLLFRNGAGFALAVASSGPMTAAAGMLGNEPPMSVVQAAACVGLWMTALAVALHVFPRPRPRRILVAAATVWAAGGPVLLYLRNEFGAGNAENSWVLIALAGPTWAALQVLWGDGGRAVYWLPSTVLCASGAIVAILVRLISFRKQ